MAFRENLKTFIEQELNGEDKSLKIDDNEGLLERGILDSMSLLQLINYIEQQTGVKIADTEITPDNFQTILSIEQLVKRLQSNRQV